MHKGQTATEYIIILAVVIIIALIVVGALGIIPGLGGNAQNNVDDAAQLTAVLGITEFLPSNNGQAYVLMRNNLQKRVTISNITVNGEEIRWFLDTGINTTSFEGGQTKALWLSIGNLTTLPYGINRQDIELYYQYYYDGATYTFNDTFENHEVVCRPAPDYCLAYDVVRTGGVDLSDLLEIMSDQNESSSLRPFNDKDCSGILDVPEITKVLEYFGDVCV